MGAKIQIFSRKCPIKKYESEWISVICNENTLSKIWSSADLENYTNDQTDISNLTKFSILWHSPLIGFFTFFKSYVVIAIVIYLSDDLLIQSIINSSKKTPSKTFKFWDFDCKESQENIL